MKVYSTYRNSDETGGKGPMILDLTFLYKGDATAYVESKPDPYGRPRQWVDGHYGDWEIRSMVVVESLEGIPVADEYAQRRLLRQQALAKLTQAEKEVLGIT